MNAVDTIVASLIQSLDLIAPVQVVAHLSSVNHQNVQLQAANGDFVLKYYAVNQDERELFYEQHLVRWLSWRPTSFAVPLPLRGRTIMYTHKAGNHFYTLTPFITGEAPEFRLLPNGQHHPAINQWAYAMGLALGELQTLLQDRPVQHRRPSALFQALLNYAQPRYDPLQLSAAQFGGSASDDELWAWWRSEAASLMAFVANEYPSLPQQVCHNDFAPPNILMRDERVAAILDFEFACPAARALDVAMALRMIMQLDSNPANPWAVAEHFCRGYAAWIKLTPQEIAAMPQLIGLRTAIPLIWAISKPEPPSHTSLEQAIRRMQASKAWMHQHQGQLIDLLQTMFAS
ncbi:phosphotransferase [Herpetosiphon giganteus]|uniref:phosphotransferase n=1 Tax=Herpetosiphon giganteus TaxID=2029754 RepID=UPI00195F0D2D|nr:phosphotransferase [Herpetosiphon giganteus]MBM7846588.1 Ser/Thr protein kinase RdoA (MazF antagonist) [Herpetosiphon giganteus]